jgi:hypothetical protein
MWTYWDAIQALHNLELDPQTPWDCKKGIDLCMDRLMLLHEAECDKHAKYHEQPVVEEPEYTLDNSDTIVEVKDNEKL